jgi:hypothetical protein
MLFIVAKIVTIKNVTCANQFFKKLWQISKTSLSYVEKYYSVYSCIIL